MHVTIVIKCSVILMTRTLSNGILQHLVCGQPDSLLFPSYSANAINNRKVHRYLEVTGSNPFRHRI